MSRGIEGRISKLEQFSEPDGPFVVLPLPCKTVDEWIAMHAPKGATH
jgi:hypothetical protein